MYDFSERDIIFLRQLARDYQSGALHANPRQLKRPSDEAPLEIAIGKTSEAIPADDSGDVARWTVTEDEFAAVTPTETVTAYNWTGGAIATDTNVILVRLAHKEGARWIAINASGQSGWIEFTLTEALSVSDTDAQASVDNYWGGPDPGSTVTVWNKAISVNYLFAGVTGAKGLATYDERAGKWRIVQMECG